MKQSERFEILDRETKQIVGALLEDIRASLTQDIQHQTEAIAQLFSRREIVIVDNKSPDKRVIVDAFLPDQENDSQIVFETREKEECLRKDVNRDILESLQFEAQTERYEGIAEAHERTFKWIYQKTQPEDNHWDNFVDWLEYGNGLYWINGKAGSGKSTLMKYICHNSLTCDYLATWAQGKRLCTAEFYFWDLGTSLQKSQIGLFRSLLCEILRQAPTLIPLVVPETWAMLYSSRSLSQDTRVYRNLYICLVFFYFLQTPGTPFISLVFQPPDTAWVAAEAWNCPLAISLPRELRLMALHPVLLGVRMLIREID
jgi:hypothetical protein